MSWNESIRKLSLVFLFVGASGCFASYKNDRMHVFIFVWDWFIGGSGLLHEKHNSGTLLNIDNASLLLKLTYFLFLYSTVNSNGAPNNHHHYNTTPNSSLSQSTMYIHINTASIPIQRLLCATSQPKHTTLPSILRHGSRCRHGILTRGLAKGSR
jgi:hypothetical protein